MTERINSGSRRRIFIIRANQIDGAATALAGLLQVSGNTSIPVQDDRPNALPS